jgi:predicted phage terminase large subunit-like protein
LCRISATGLTNGGFVQRNVETISQLRGRDPANRNDSSAAISIGSSRTPRRKYPIKPQDAQSKSVRDKTIQWYENTLLSRLDDKVHGAIVVVMQRLHLDDLAGHLLEKGGFEHLCLPAIAEAKQNIELGHGRVHVRKRGDVLDPNREPLSALERQRAAMTPLVFSAQFQQSPIPLEGNLIKREWIRYFSGNPPPQEGDYFVISWDTAMKANELADYSVGTVWRVKDRGQKILLVDLVRGRFEYPELVAAASALYRKWKVGWATTNLVIEDKGSGSSLIQSLKSERIWAHQHHAKLEGDKVMRLSAQAAHFHAGSVHFPQDAAWLGELMLELLGFPGVRHDDQVDSVSQALAFTTGDVRYWHKADIRLTLADSQPQLAVRIPNLIERQCHHKHANDNKIRPNCRCANAKNPRTYYEPRSEYDVDPFFP